MSRNLFILGNFPPPVTGNSASLESIASDLEEIPDLNVTRLNLSPPHIVSTTGSGAKKVHLYLKYWALLIIHSLERHKKLYTVCEGDRALFLTLLTIILCRVLRYQVTLHHHSYGYINDPIRLMKWINKALSRQDAHVFLSDGMSQDFFKKYSPRKTHLVNHNFAQLGGFMSEAAKKMHPQTSASRKRYQIGLLSNLIMSKGVDTFLEVAREAVRQDLPFDFHLAGPIPGEAEQKLVDKARVDLDDRFQYSGPLYGTEKLDFLCKLDVFLFPTRYYHEAQPIVILEALACGCSVISTDRGAISEDLQGLGGTILEKRHQQNIESYITALSNLAYKLPSSKEIAAQAQLKQTDAVEKYFTLVKRLSGHPPIDKRGT